MELRTSPVAFLALFLLTFHLFTTSIQDETTLLPTTIEQKVQPRLFDPKREQNDNDKSTRDDIHRSPLIHDQDDVKQEDEAVQNETDVQNEPSPAPSMSSDVVDYSTECDCRNEFANYSCCERIIYAAHKHGFVLVEDTFRHLYWERNFWIRSFRTWQKQFPNEKDFRHILVTRNWVEALVSGYLYHKSGMECDKGPHGEPQAEPSPWTTNWKYFLTLHAPSDKSNICQYLNQTSTRKGMRALMDWSLHYFYRNLVLYWETVQSDPEIRARVLHVCYQDFAAQLPAMMGHAFPGGYTFTTPSVAPLTAAHATTHDEDVRNQLRDLVRELDRTVFNGTVAYADQLFGC